MYQFRIEIGKKEEDKIQQNYDNNMLKQNNMTYQFNLLKDLTIMTLQEAIKIDKLYITMSIGAIGFIVSLIINKEYVYSDLASISTLPIISLILLSLSIFIKVIIILPNNIKKLTLNLEKIQYTINQNQQKIGEANNKEKSIDNKLKICDKISIFLFYIGITLLPIYAMIIKFNFKGV